MVVALSTCYFCSGTPVNIIIVSINHKSIYIIYTVNHCYWRGTAVIPRLDVDQPFSQAHQAVKHRLYSLFISLKGPEDLVVESIGVRGCWDWVGEGEREFASNSRKDPGKDI